MHLILNKKKLKQFFFDQDLIFANAGVILKNIKKSYKRKLNIKEKSSKKSATAYV
jgi:hypothetical protein